MRGIWKLAAKRESFMPRWDLETAEHEFAGGGHRSRTAGEGRGFARARAHRGHAAKGRATRYKDAERPVREIDSLNSQIGDCENFETHDQFMERLRKTHPRKTGFWPLLRDSMLCVRCLAIGFHSLKARLADQAADYMLAAPSAKIGNGRPYACISGQWPVSRIGPSVAQRFEARPHTA
jgi:hypothetical protein